MIPLIALTTGQTIGAIGVVILVLVVLLAFVYSAFALSGSIAAREDEEVNRARLAKMHERAQRRRAAERGEPSDGGNHAA